MVPKHDWEKAAQSVLRLYIRIVRRLITYATGLCFLPSLQTFANFFSPHDSHHLFDAADGDVYHLSIMEYQ